MTRGGARAGAGRKPTDPLLKKVPFSTKLPRWLKEWLTANTHEQSAAQMIEDALRASFKLSAPGAAAHSETE